MNTEALIEKYSKREPAKPPKPGFDGFGGIVSGEKKFWNGPDTPSPVEETDFQRVVERYGNRVARLIPHDSYDLLAGVWPGMYRRIADADAELSRLWLSARRGERSYPDTFPPFVTALRKWTRLNIEAARYVRYLDRGIRRIYSRNLGEWVYIVKDKAVIRGVRFNPRGAAYTLQEARALVEANPGPDELRTLHRTKAMFQGELS